MRHQWNDRKIATCKRCGLKYGRVMPTCDLRRLGRQIVTDAEREELRRLAGEATPGPWVLQDWDLKPGEAPDLVGWDGWDVATLGEDAGDPHALGRWIKDSRYLAACSPERILSLLDEVDRLRAEAIGRPHAGWCAGCTCRPCSGPGCTNYTRWGGRCSECCEVRP